MELEFAVLGPLTVRGKHCGELTIPSGQQRVLLAALLLRANQVVPLDELIDRLWGPQPPDGVRNTVRAYAMRLRRVLAAGTGTRKLITTHPEGYSLHVPQEKLDLLRFQALLKQAGTAAHTTGSANEAQLLREALELWRGPALSNVDSDSLHRDLVSPLNERRLQALERRIDLDLQHGAEHEVVAELQGLTSEYPLHERFWAQLMLSLYRCGRQAEAMHTYRHVHRLLDTELGVAPGTELNELHQAILSADPSVERPQTQRDTGLSRSVGVSQLPPDIRGLVGRTELINKALALLADVNREWGMQIVTLSGQPGVGKTALAVRIGHRLRAAFPDGQVLLDLHGHSEHAALTTDEALSHLLRLLGVPPELVPHDVDDKIRHYRSLVADHRILVILDNASTSEQVRPLLPSDSRCAVLVTSRNELRGLIALQNARPIPVEALSPTESNALLSDILGSDTVAAEPNATAVLADLCGHLPLALRIAAANIAARPTVQLSGYVTELQHGNRLAQLTVDEDEDAAVRRTFDLSYETLPASTQLLFRRLALIPGTDVTTDTAAAAVGGPADDASRGLSQLTNANLIEEHAPGRFRIHDLLHEYATFRAQHEDTYATRINSIRRVFNWYLYTADAAARMLHPRLYRMPLELEPVDRPTHCFTSHDEALRWCIDEDTNLLAAVHYAAEIGDHATAWKLPVALARYCVHRKSWTGWLPACRLALNSAQRDNAPEGQIWAYYLIAVALRDTGLPDAAVQECENALEVSRTIHDRAGEAWSRNLLGLTFRDRGQLERTMEYSHQALELFESLGERHGQAWAWVFLGLATQEQGEPEAAVNFYQRARAIFCEIKDYSGESWVLNFLGRVSQSLDRFDDAIDYCHRALFLTQEISDHRSSVWILNTLSAVNGQIERFDDAISYCSQALEICRSTGDRYAEATVSDYLATILYRDNQASKARQAWLDAAAILDQLDSPRADRIRQRIKALDNRCS